MDETDFSSLSRPIHPMLDSVKAALVERGLVHAYCGRPPYQQTVDWTSFPGAPSDERNARPDDVSAIAVRDLDGIVKAEAFILLAGVPEGRAKYAELGAAIMSAVRTGKPRIYVIGEDPVHSVFFFHPTVKRVISLDEVLNDIEESLR